MKETNPRMCEEPGCHRKGQHLGSYFKTGDKKGQPRRRAKCTKHHFMKYGIAGWEYKQHRKTYCENKDGRLGFKCTTTIMDVEYQLEVDHIDENHSNNDINNLQTLCACCHRMKTKYRREDNQQALNFMIETINNAKKVI